MEGSGDSCCRLLAEEQEKQPVHQRWRLRCQEKREVVPFSSARLLGGILVSKTKGVAELEREFDGPGPSPGFRQLGAV